MPLVDFLHCGDTVTAECYCSTLQRLWQVIYHKRPWFTYQDIIILYDHVRPKIASYTCAQLWYYGWEDMDHPCYSLILHPVISISLNPFRSIWQAHFAIKANMKHPVTFWLQTLDTNLPVTGYKPSHSGTNSCTSLVSMWISHYYHLLPMCHVYT